MNTDAPKPGRLQGMMDSAKQAIARTAPAEIAAARRFYNDAVTVLADSSHTYPGKFFVSMVLPKGVPPLLDLDVTAS